MDTLTPLDHEILKYRWIAKATANRLTKKHPYCHWEDLESACWWGVVEGLKNHEPEKRTLLSSLFYRAEKEALNFLRYWRRKGFKFHYGRTKADKIPEVTELEPLLCLARPEHEYWSDEEWKAILAPLPPKVARMMEMRFREFKETDEIAAELGCVESNVRSQINRNTKKLGETLCPQPTSSKTDY